MNFVYYFICFRRTQHNKKHNRSMEFGFHLLFILYIGMAAAISPRLGRRGAHRRGGKNRYFLVKYLFNFSHL